MRRNTNGFSGVYRFVAQGYRDTFIKFLEVQTPFLTSFDLQWIW